MKKLLLLSLMMLVLVVLLSACGDAEPTQIKNAGFEYMVFYVDSMPCVWAQDIKAGGLSCDWTKYHPGE